MKIFSLVHSGGIRWESPEEDRSYHGGETRYFGAFHKLVVRLFERYEQEFGNQYNIH